MTTILRIKPPRPKCDASSCTRPAYGTATILAFYWGLVPGQLARLCLGHFYGTGCKLEEGLGQQFIEIFQV